MYSGYFAPNRVKDPLKLVRVSPFAFEFGLRGLKEEFGCHYRWKLGAILGGEWDRSIKNIEEMAIFVAFNEVYRNGYQWHETQFYKNSVEQIRKGIKMRDCKTEKEFQNRISFLNSLYTNISVHGYKTQRELGLSYDSSEIVSCIDRNGNFLLFDGRHRLAIARLLNLDTIPVVVCARHKEWQVFANKFRRYIKKSGGTSRYPILHPDLQDIAFKYDHSTFSTIIQNLPLYRGKFLNISSGLDFGYFSHRFEDHGFECSESNLSENELQFVEKLRNAGRKHFEIIPGSIIDVPLEQEFEVVLAIDVFHHFLKTESLFAGFIRFLKSLKTKSLIFRHHIRQYPDTKHAFRHLKPSEFVNIISENTALKRSEVMAKGKDEGLLYFLYQS